MVKIFPTRFFMENADTTTEQLWAWVNEKIVNSKISQIIPLQMEFSTSKSSHIIKGLIEVHSTENITTSELANILKPHPSFIQQIQFTFQ